LSAAANPAATLLTVVVGASLVFLMSSLLTRKVRFLAARMGVVDVPGGRRQHAQTTPRGGGLAIVAVVLVLAWFLLAFGYSPSWTAAMAIGGLLVAIVGGLDDLLGLPALARLAVHLLAAGFVALFAWYPHALAVGVGPFGQLAGFGAVVWTTLLIGWTLNAVNFMDGIDGLAASTTVAVALGMLACGVVHHAGSLPPLAWLLLDVGVAAATGGFLYHNWPPATVFLGDVGSGFLGFALMVLALWADAASVAPLTCFLVLMGCFYVDTGWTLLRRALRFQPVWHAHSEHAFHQALRRGFSHRQISLAYLSVVLLWSAPLALLAATGWVPGWIVVTVAYLPLLAGAIALGAGTPAPEDASPGGEAQ
jgi:Fuc2NAc and GlcNAc transferase